VPEAPLFADDPGAGDLPVVQMALAVRILTATVVSAFARIVQRRMIYLPAGQPRAAPEQLLEGGSAVVLHTEDGLDLTAWHAPATGPATAITVLVLPDRRVRRLVGWPRPSSPGLR
jgi:hypothetical protein